MTQSCATRHAGNTVTRMRSRHAFTVLEVIVALVLTTVMVMVMTRWVNLSADLTSTSAANSGAQRTMLAISAGMAEDFNNAVPCDGARRSSMFASASRKRVVLFRDTNGDGNPERVTWELTGPQYTKLTRSVAPTDGCEPAAGQIETSTLTDSIHPGQVSVFEPRIGGAPYRFPNDNPVQCTSQPTLCNWQAIGVKLAIDSYAGDNQPATLEEVFALNWRTVRLPLAQIGAVTFDGLTTESQKIVGVVPRTHATINDLDLVAHVKLDDYTPSAVNIVAAHGLPAPANTAGWAFGVNTDGGVLFRWSHNGTAFNQVVSPTKLSPAVADGSTVFIRAVVDFDTDAGLRTPTVSFFRSDSGTSWTALGAAVAVPQGQARIFNADVPVTVGNLADNSLPTKGQIISVHGWTSPNVLGNGWFYDGTDSGATGWGGYSTSPGVPFTFSRDTGGGPGGRPYLRVSWTGTADNVGAVRSSGVSGGSASCASAWVAGRTMCLWPNTTYRLSYQARSDEGAFGHTMTGGVGALDNPSNAVTLRNPALRLTWQEYMFEFRTGAVTSGNVYVIVNGSVPAGSVDIAGVTLEMVHPNRSAAYNPAVAPYTNPAGTSEPGIGMRQMFGFRASQLSPGAMTGAGDAGESWTADPNIAAVIV